MRIASATDVRVREASIASGGERELRAPWWLIIAMHSCGIRVFSKEIRDGRVFSEKSKDMRSQHDSAEQQAHYRRKPGTAR